MDEKPLRGLRVLVTRPEEVAEVLAERLRTLGAFPIVLPTIQFRPPADPRPLDRAIQCLKHKEYNWVIFTSATGVRFFWKRLAAWGHDPQLFSGVKLAAIGPATAQALKERGVCVDYVPPRYVAEEIAAGLGDVTHQKILLPRADIARKAFAQLLLQRGAQVDEIAVYRTEPVKIEEAQMARIKAMLQGAQIDVVAFTSSSTVRHFLGLLEDPSLLKGAIIVCIGPITAATAQELGLKVNIVAREHTIEGLIQATIEEVKAHA